MANPHNAAGAGQTSDNEQRVYAPSLVQIPATFTDRIIQLLDRHLLPLSMRCRWCGEMQRQHLKFADCFKALRPWKFGEIGAPDVA